MSRCINFNTTLSAEPVGFVVHNQSRQLNFETDRPCSSLQTVYQELDEVKTHLNKVDGSLNDVLTKVEDMEELVAVLNSDAETDGSVDNKIRKAIQWKTL